MLNFIRYRDRALHIDIWHITISVIHPAFFFNKKCVGFICKTMLMFRLHDWKDGGNYYPWVCGGVVLIAGFGIGVVYKHVDNYYTKKQWKDWRKQ